MDDGSQPRPVSLRFRSSLTPVWGCVLLHSVVHAGVPCLFAAARWGAGMLVLWVGLTALFGAAATLSVYLYPVYVRTDGLRSYTSVGFYRTIPWDRVTAVRAERVAGFDYLVVGETGGWFPVWVPLSLTDFPTFATAVRACVGEAHPLAESLGRLGEPVS